jgi:2-amino-4-hydroxy-6-hydroxymethyldihydropteridine diphosphokinase
MVSTLLGLGTNLGDRAGNLEAAVAGLSRFLDVTGQSSIYETAPMYVEDQSPFLNMVLAAETGMAPEPLLSALKQLERRLGRVPGERFGPRVIDLDILFYADRTISAPGLEIPHPRLAERAFVLVPAAEIAPDWRHPASGHTVRELAARLTDRQDVQLWQPERRDARVAYG